MVIRKIKSFRKVSFFTGLFCLFNTLLGAQYTPTKLPFDQRIGSSVQLNDSILVTVGQEVEGSIFDNEATKKGFLLVQIFKTNTNVAPNQIWPPVPNSELDIVQYNNDSSLLVVIGHHSDSVSGLLVPWLFTLDRQLNWESFHQIELPPNNQNLRINRMVVEDSCIVLAYDLEQNPPVSSSNHFAKIDFEGKVKNLVTVSSESNYFSCSSLCKGFLNSEYVFTMFTPNNSEHLLKLDSSFNISYLKQLPYKDSATNGNPGYSFYNAVGAKVVNDKYYLALRHNVFYNTMPPTTDRTMCLMILNEQFDTIKTIEFGTAGHKVVLTGFSVSNNNEKYMSGYHDFSPQYPPAGSSSTLLYGKINDDDELEWTNSFQRQDQFLFSRSSCLFNNNLTIAGWVYQEGVTAYNDPFLLFTDSLGDVNGISHFDGKMGHIPFLYPNPADNLLTINLPESAGKNHEFTIWTIDGKLRQRLMLTGNQTTVDISDLDNGLYLAKINAASLRFVVHH